MDLSTTLCTLAGLEPLETGDRRDIGHLLQGGHGEVHRVGVTAFAWSKSIRKGHYRHVHYPPELRSK